jgi:hypothetical protein
MNEKCRRATTPPCKYLEIYPSIRLLSMSQGSSKPSQMPIIGRSKGGRKLEDSFFGAKEESCLNSYNLYSPLDLSEGVATKNLVRIESIEVRSVPVVSLLRSLSLVRFPRPLVRPFGVGLPCSWKSSLFAARSMCCGGRNWGVFPWLTRTALR